jgi:hypothetical protein
MVALLTGGATACVHQGPPPVGLRALQANLVFSTTPPPPPPPALAPVAPLSPGSGPTTYALDLGGQGQPIYKLRPPLPTAAPCPTATHPYPAEEATSNSSSLPVTGSYRWKRSGTYQLNLAPNITLPTSGFETRLVRNVEKVASDGSEYRFETVQPDLRGSMVVSRWQVKTAALSATPQELAVTAPNIGDPERGLALLSQTLVGTDGKVQHQYTFNPGVLFVPLPIQAGEQFQGVGVDPASGETLTVNGAIDRHQRVDACGEVLDGWQVNTSETFSGATSQPATYNYIVAPQLGAVIIGEHLDTTTADGHFVLDYTVGQVRPDPLPAGSK